MNKKEQKELDLMVYGNYLEIDGKRILPTEVYYLSNTDEFVYRGDHFKRGTKEILHVKSIT